MKFQIIQAVLLACFALAEEQDDNDWKTRQHDKKDLFGDAEYKRMFQDYDDEDLEEAIGKFESNVLVTKERMVRYLCTEDFVTN